MTYYSFKDTQVGSILFSGRNSTTLDELVSAKLEYHSDLDEDISKIYDLGKIDGKLQCCYDFEFYLIKHEGQLPDDDYDEYSKNWGDVDIKSLSFKEALKEFGGFTE